MKNVFHFMLNASFVPEKFIFCFELDMINFRIYDVPEWATKNYNTYISQYLNKLKNQAIKFGQLLEYNTKNIFLEKSYAKCSGKVSLRSFYNKSKLNISLYQQPEML